DIGKRAHSFEVAVRDVAAPDVPAGEYAKAVWRLDRLHDMLQVTDVLAVAVPITPESRGLIGEKEIRALKPKSYVMVVSRGGIVDEAALLPALQDGHLAGAGIDVTATEPLPPQSPLWE